MNTPKKSPGLFGWIGIIVGIFFGALFLYSLVAPSPQLAPQAVTITAGDSGIVDINLWSAPTDSARLVGIVRDGDHVELIARSTESDRVEIRTAAGVEGWLNKGFIGES